METTSSLPPFRIFFLSVQHPDIASSPVKYPCQKARLPAELHYLKKEQRGGEKKKRGTRRKGSKERKKDRPPCDGVHHDDVDGKSPFGNSATMNEETRVRPCSKFGGVIVNAMEQFSTSSL
jgi:hypothetical protein